MRQISLFDLACLLAGWCALMFVALAIVSGGNQKRDD